MLARFVQKSLLRRGRETKRRNDPAHDRFGRDIASEAEQGRRSEGGGGGGLEIQMMAKSEIRMSKSERNPKSEIRKKKTILRLNFRHPVRPLAALSRRRS